MCFYGHKEKKEQDCYKNDYVGNTALPGTVTAIANIKKFNNKRVG